MHVATNLSAILNIVVLSEMLLLKVKKGAEVLGHSTRSFCCLCVLDILFTSSRTISSYLLHGYFPYLELDINHRLQVDFGRALGPSVLGGP